MYENGQKYSKILEEKLATDFTDFADLFGHKKAQKTSVFVPITLGLQTDRRRKIRRRLPKLTGNFLTLISLITQ
jgi:DNA polymerase elongation subunit (family B)